MGWTPIAPWKIIAGTGQSLSLTSATEAAFANKVGAQTYAIAVSLAPASTAYGALVTVSHAGTAATSSTDYFIKSTDNPAILGCAPGDKVTLYPTANGTGYLCELTH